VGSPIFGCAPPTGEPQCAPRSTIPLFMPPDLPEQRPPPGPIKRDAEIMAAEAAGRALLEVIDRVALQRGRGIVIAPESDFATQLALAGFARSRSLFESMIVLSEHEQWPAVSVVLRTLADTYLAGTYAAIGGLDAAERMLRSDYAYRVDQAAAMGADAEEIEPWIPTAFSPGFSSDPPTSADKLPSHRLFKRLIDTCRANGDSDGARTIERIRTHVWGTASHFSAHGTVAAIIGHRSALPPNPVWPDGSFAISTEDHDPLGHGPVFALVVGRALLGQQAGWALRKYNQDESELQRLFEDGLPFPQEPPIR
jgi:hypothetical protein